MRRSVLALALLAGAAFAEITVGPTVANAVKLGSAGIAAVNAGTAPVWTSAPPEPVLVHYWSFEGHQEDVVGDWDLTAQVGTTPTYPDGHFGKYIYEGTASSVGRKEGPSGLPQPNAPWSLCFWYKRVPAFDTWWNVLWGNDADLNAYPGGGTVNDKNENRTSVALWNVFGSDIFLFFMPFVHDDYIWTHFTVVNDGSGPSSGYKFYKNGVQITQGVWLLWDSFVTQPVTYTPQHFFHITQNNIDEVRLYSGALTAVQVETLFASYGYEPAFQDPLVYYKCDDNDATTTVLDYGPADSDGTAPDITANLTGGGHVNGALWLGDTSLFVAGAGAATPLSSTTFTVAGLFKADGSGGVALLDIRSTAYGYTYTLNYKYSTSMFQSYTRNGSAPWQEGYFPHMGNYWMHVAVVRNGSSYTTYVNGNVLMSETISVGGMSVDVLNIGASYDAQGSGQWMDELRIYDVALPPEEVMALAASYNLPPEVAQQITAYFIPGESCSADYYSAQYTPSGTFGSLPTAYHYDGNYQFNYWRDENWNAYYTDTSVPGSDIYLYAEYYYAGPSTYSVYPNSYPPSTDPWVVNPGTEYSSFLPTDFWWEGTYYMISGWSSSNSGWIDNGSGYYVNGNDTVTPSYYMP